MSPTLETLIERLLALILTPDNRLKATVSLFVGAGVSREYGVPTSAEFARLFFASALSGVDAEARRIFEATPDEQKVEKFIAEFRRRLNTQLAYSFFKKVEYDSVSKSRSSRSLTYERIVDLWRTGYINLVITTNFDSLLEKAARKVEVEDDDTFKISVLDYNDLGRTERPPQAHSPVLVKLAGDIDRSNMLWTETEFETKISSLVTDWLTAELHEDPLILLGYAANEAPIRRFLIGYQAYVASVDVKERREIPNLDSLAKTRGRAGTDHAQASAQEFVEAIYEALYHRTKDERLRLSLRHLRERLQRLNSERRAEGSLPVSVDGRSAQRQAEAFAVQTQPANRLGLLFGDAGYGKTVIGQRLSRSIESREDSVAIYIPGSELFHGSLDAWLLRVKPDGDGFHQLCQLVNALNVRLLLVLDGLNEVRSTEVARALLHEVTGLMDAYDDGNIRCLITCRSDFWRRLKFDFRRTYVNSPILVQRFEPDELTSALESAHFTRLSAPRHRAYLELLRVPENLGLAAKHGLLESSAYSELEIYKLSLEQELQRVPSATEVLVWLCYQMEKYTSLSCNLLLVETSGRWRDELTGLADAGLLQISEFGTARFQRDRMGEYVYGALFLYRYRWRESSSVDNDISWFLRDLVSQYNALRDERETAFKIMLSNALIFFAACCTADELEALYSTKEPFVRTIIRAAVILKRGVVVRDAWRDDPVLMSAAFLDESNFDALAFSMFESDRRFLAEFPLNFVSKLFPEASLAFLLYSLSHAQRRVSQPEGRRRYAGVIINSLLVFVLRNGPERLLEEMDIVKSLRSFVEQMDPNFLSSRLEEALQENSRLLLHWNGVDKIGQIHEIEPYWRDALSRAVQESMFSVGFNDINALIRLNAPTRLVLKFIFCRDYTDARLLDWLEFAFGRDEPQVHDFAMGILGWMSKLDPRFLPVAEQYLTRMRVEYPSNFYRRTLPSNEDESMTQYDPIVPYATTILSRGERIDIDRVLGGGDQDAGFRVGRLAEKTLLDFPEETLAFLYDFDERFETTPEMEVPFRIAARLFPLAFWKQAQRRNPTDLFDISGDEMLDLHRVISQVRDFDWWHTLRFCVESPSRREALTRWLSTLLDSKDIGRYALSLLRSLLSL